MNLPEFQQRIVAAAEEGALVLTANNRLAKQLRSAYDQAMRVSGCSVWRAPAIFSVPHWQERALAQLGEDDRLLSRFAAQRLLETVIEDDATGDLELLQVPATARRVLQAHQLLSEYGGTPETLPLTEDHRAFLRWRRLYLDACREGGWLDPAGLIPHLCAAIGEGRLVAPSKVLLAGFDEMSPDLRRLAAAFADAGAAVEEHPPATRPPGRLLRYPCVDAADEARRTARWARSLLEVGASRIGIVVPNLEDYRPLIERAFLGEIDPAALLDLADEGERFSLSLGSPLGDQGLVVAACEILAVTQRMSLDRASFLLRTPYLGGSVREGGRRAELEVRLRSGRGEEVFLDSLEQLAAGEAAAIRTAMPKWGVICAALRKSLKNGGRRSPGDWGRHFAELLHAVGWPGERPLGSAEYQVLAAWREKLLPALVALDPVAPPMERGEALVLLRRLAAEIPFQTDAPDGPVQVLGALEAAGMSFDHLWVMGLDEESLPAPPRPNPFIPVSLQVERGMPSSSAERELQYARAVFARLVAAAPEVILSYPQRQGDCPVRPSPLITAVPEGEVLAAPSYDPRSSASGVALEVFTDALGPRFDCSGPARGGTAILRDQALCPFRAFARHRLGARALDEPEIGLDAPTRGTLLHLVLQAFWEQNACHAELLALEGEQLESAIAEAIERACGELRGKRGGLADPLLELEKRRLGLLVREWLEVERQRPSFTVRECEAEYQATFGGLTITTKVDRIDELADGSRMILDYKSGRVDLDDLLGARLLEPQLPIYGCEAEAVAAVAVASVRRGECALKGVARTEGLLPGVSAFSDSKAADKHGVAGWEELLERWRGQLDGLGAEFLAGEAAVAPADLKKACHYCDLTPLCRIDEAGARVPEEP